MNFLKSNGPASQRQSGRADETSLQPALYVVATPIGNARDITLRALDVLASVNAILAEDTRVTAKLMSIHGLKKPLIAVHDHNESAAATQAVRRIRDGEALALVSDAGTPLVSDPGFKLVRAVIEAGLPVIPLPGPSSALAALVVSGLPPDRFMFCGFLPPKSAARSTALEALKSLQATLIFLEAPGRLAASLSDMSKIFGPRPAAVGRELTKLYEECVRGELGQLARDYADKPPPKGELVVIVGPPLQDTGASQSDLDAALEMAMAESPLGQAAADVAKALGIPRRTVYERALVLAGKKKAE